jgi:ankyrin repeat protein
LILEQGCVPLAILGFAFANLKTLEQISVAKSTGGSARNAQAPAALRDSLEIAHALFAGGETIGVFDDNILFNPISDGHIKLVALLLDHGASVSAKVEGYTPTELATKYGHKDIYDLLLARGATPVAASQAAQVALVQAAGSANISGMAKALADGAQIDTPDPDGETPLVAALRLGVLWPNMPESIMWLLDHGASPNARGESHLSGVEGIPLHLFVVVSGKYMDDVRDEFKKTNPQDTERLAETRKLAEVVLARLLKAGANVSARDAKLKTALHWASALGELNAARALIEAGAFVQAKDEAGRAPIDYAESAPIIALLEKGAQAETK